jgi:hypothetical protein
MPRWIPVLFWIAALYDGVLGALFLLAPDLLFRMFEVTPPNHMGYVRFPAALILIFGLLFVAVARNPVRNRSLIPYGILLKVAYVGVSGGYWMAGGIPGMWKPFTIADAAMGALFAWAYVVLPASPPADRSA